MSNRTPQYRRYSKSYARVKLGGNWIHLGQYDDPDSKAEYERLIAQWAVGCPLEATPAPEGISMAELLAGYLEHAEAYFGHDANHVGYLKRLIKIVRELFAETPVSEFGPRKLKTVREAFVAKGWVRNKVNEAVRNVIAMFSWGAEQEWVSGSLVHTLREVRTLRRGHCSAPESRIVHERGGKQDAGWKPAHVAGPRLGFTAVSPLLSLPRVLA